MIKSVKLEELRTDRSKMLCAVRNDLTRAYKPLLRDLIELSYATLTHLDDAQVKAIAFVHANLIGKILLQQNANGEFALLRQLYAARDLEMILWNEANDLLFEHVLEVVAARLRGRPEDFAGYYFVLADARHDMRALNETG